MVNDPELMTRLRGKGVRANMDDYTPSVETHTGIQIGINWSWPGCGFGQLHVYEENGTIKIDNECMSRDRVRKILHAFADYIANNGVLDDE